MLAECCGKLMILYYLEYEVFNCLTTLKLIEALGTYKENSSEDYLPLYKIYMYLPIFVFNT